MFDNNYVLFTEYEAMSIFEEIEILENEKNFKSIITITDIKSTVKFITKKL